jgi:protein-tyrosine kinase
LSFIEKALQKAKESAPASVSDSQRPVPEKPSAILRETCGIGELKGEMCYTITRNVPVDANTLERNRLIAGSANTLTTEAYKHLRTQILQKTLEEHRNVLMFISPLPDEGKTLTTINLAISISQELDQTVLLVDADLRSPSIHRYFGLPKTMGLGDYLEGRASIPELLVHPEGFNRLVILPGGKPTSWASEIIRSRQMSDLVKELKHYYADRYVLLDLPPLLSYADGLAFAPKVDGIVVIVEARKTPQEDLLRCKEMLEKFPVLGYVFNKADNLDSKRYYGHNGHPGTGWFSSLKHLIAKK